MTRKTNYLPHCVIREELPNGSLLLKSAYDLGPVVKRTGDWLHQWQDEAPDRVFIAERSGAGWRSESYAATLQKVRALGQALLARGMGAHTPILIMSGNGVDHGLLTLAAQYVGVPTVPVAEQYALIHGAHGRLRHAVELVNPHMVYAVDADRYGEALALDIFDDVERVVSGGTIRPGLTSFDDLLRGDGSVDVDAAFDAVTPDTVAKILMTSGSTSSPKGVLTTQRMMCTNQTQLADALPFLRDRPPVIVDWLPWNHVFGGSHNFNMMLANGGSFYVDDGKPVAGLFDRTVENLSLTTGTLCFNVPVGFSMLLGALRKDTGLQARFFRDLDMIFYAGATLPQDVWDGFENMALDQTGSIPLMTSSWGLTETAPACLLQHEPVRRSGVVGVPLNGVNVKLIPNDSNRYEIRVKGPSVMTGYFEDPEKTIEAFDDEGYFMTGDAMSFVDPDDINKGLKFDGRISEDFKLLTGTWVRAANLRLDVLANLAPIAADLVITGADKNEIGVMIFPNMAALAEGGYATTDDNGAIRCDLLQGELHRRLAERARNISGSSTRIARAIVLSEPASMPEGEMTAKGNLNFRKVLTRRAALLERLYADGDAAVVTI